MHINLLSYLGQPIIKESYARYNHIWGKNINKPYLNYFGINFDEKGILSIKIYFHFFNELDVEDLNFFLPVLDDFNKYYSLCEISNNSSAENTGIAFSIKFKRDNLIPSYGFHYRLKSSKQSYDLIGQPRALPFNVLDFNINPGINYEYSNGKILRKQYYYFDSFKHKLYFAQRFNYDFLKKVKYIEYAESDTLSKINAWGHEKDDTYLLNRFTQEENRLIQSLCKQYNLVNTVFGFYENSDIRSTYFLSKESLNNSVILKNYRNTLKQVYETHNS